jgi:RNA polymerase sigma-54 factor
MIGQSQNLVLKQSQNLVMTQAMQQSLKILQLSSLDLINFIESELEKNPLLEIEGDSSENSDTGESETNDSEYSEFEKDSFDNLNSEDFKQNDSALDNNSDDGWNTTEASDSNNYDSDLEFDISNVKDFSDDAGKIIEKTLSNEITLKQHLLDQVLVDFSDVKEKIIAEHLIDMLDSNGYFSSENFADDLNNLSINLGCDLTDIESVILKLQKCDPIGVCARSLKECLKIQLNEKQTLDIALEKLLENLELLAKGELEKLCKICGVDHEDLKEMIKEIKLLNPLPASKFSEDKPQTKHADLILEKINGKWLLDINYEILPKLSFKKDFYSHLRAKKLKGDEKKYLTENHSSANFLIKAIDHRNDTMLKVGYQIVKNQEDFFEKGINYLKPISMKDIALEVGLHESTIGRVVANKYISTPRGVFELKYFFSTSLSGTFQNTEFSTETAKHLIKELIDSETKILSDEELAKILKIKGIDIARRTVAKYREAMNIPTSATRKRLKKISS